MKKVNQSRRINIQRDQNQLSIPYVGDFIRLIRQQSVTNTTRLLDHESFLRAFKGKETTNAELIEDYVLNHNELAFEELYSRHKQNMLAYLYGILGSWEDAKDVLHDSWEAVLQSFSNSRYNEGDDFSGWFKSICYHKASDWKRTRRRFLYGGGQLPDHADESFNGEERLENNQRETLLQHGMNGLTDIEKQIVKLRIYEGKSFDEIAVARNISADAARSRYSKSLKKIKRALY